jgi:MFS transporter, PAT family, beta-lactamase induction signal transducer AmpG
MGPLAFMAGITLGGVIALRFGIMRALFLGGVLQALGILLFAVLANQGHDRLWLGIAIGGENIVDGIGSAVFVAYLSELTNIAFTATQYALLSSLTSVGRNFFASGGGWLAEHLGWTLFYVASAALALPGLILLLWLMRLYPTERSVHVQSTA